jgi:hypothetical protein
MLHSSCEGCRYKRSGGVCTDPAWNGQQVTDDSPRLCYEGPRTLNDSLVLYALEHEHEQQTKGKA